MPTLNPELPSQPIHMFSGIVPKDTSLIDAQVKEDLQRIDADLPTQSDSPLWTKIFSPESRSQLESRLAEIYEQLAEAEKNVKNLEAETQRILSKSGYQLQVLHMIEAQRQLTAAKQVYEAINASLLSIKAKLKRAPTDFKAKALSQCTTEQSGLKSQIDKISAMKSQFKAVWEQIITRDGKITYGEKGVETWRATESASSPKMREFAIAKNAMLDMKEKLRQAAKSDPALKAFMDDPVNDLLRTPFTIQKFHSDNDKTKPLLTEAKKIYWSFAIANLKLLTQIHSKDSEVYTPAIWDALTDAQDNPKAVDSLGGVFVFGPYKDITVEYDIPFVLGLLRTLNCLPKEKSESALLDLLPFVQTLLKQIPPYLFDETMHALIKEACRAGLVSPADIEKYPWSAKLNLLVESDPTLETIPLDEMLTDFTYSAAKIDGVNAFDNSRVVEAIQNRLAKLPMGERLALLEKVKTKFAESMKSESAEIPIPLHASLLYTNALALLLPLVKEEIPPTQLAAYLKVKGYGGITPLHYNLRAFWPLFDRIGQESFLNLLQIRDTAGRTPLHDLDNIKALRRVWPAIPNHLFVLLLSISDNREQTPLFNPEILEFCRPYFAKFKSETDKAMLQDLLDHKDDAGRQVTG